jgi:beta-N-acetylhexosaminidase
MYLDLSLPQVCGQLIVGGFATAALPQRFAQALSEGQRGGAILFSRNLPSLQAAQELCRAIIAACPPTLPPFIGIDEEGGRVSRLPDRSARLGSMRSLGQLAAVALTERAGRAVGRLLAGLGFNLDFAPVLDVDTNPDNPVIGDRAFGSDPDTVARLGCAFAAGLESAGIMACGKHFPGHGDTSQDSHLDLPHVAHDAARLDRVELHPFREAIRHDLTALMSAHVVFSALDPLLPATLSRRICTDLLRHEFGFSGVLFSDSLEMRALSDRLPIEQSAVGAVEAGCDVLLICADWELQQRAHAALLSRAESEPRFRERCIQATERALRARRRFPPRAQSAVAQDAVETVRSVAAEIRARSACDYEVTPHRPPVGD